MLSSADLDRSILLNAIRRVIVRLPPDALVKEAITLMGQKPSCYILVVDQQQPIGILTEHSIIRAIAAGVDLETVPLSVLMTSLGVTVAETELQSLSTVLQQFHQHHVDHLPVSADKSGEWIGILTQADIVQLMGVKAALETLQQNETRLRLAVELTQAVVWESDLINDRVCFGQEAGELELLHEMSYAESMALVHPDDRALVQRTHQMANETLGSYELEHRFFSQNHPAQWRWFLAKGQVISDEAGKPIRVIGLSIDITQRRQMEEALRQNEQFLHSIYDGIAEPIFVVDVLENGAFRYVGLNPAYERLTGFSTLVVRGKSPEQFLPLATATTVQQHYRDCLAAGEPITYEECLPCNGQDTCWLTSLTPLRDEHGRIYRLVGTGMARF